MHKLIGSGFSLPSDSCALCLRDSHAVKNNFEKKNPTVLHSNETSDISPSELHKKWETRRAEERARLEAARAERERREKEEAERRAAEEAQRKAEEERLRQEQAEAAGEGEGEGAGDKEEGKEAEEEKEGQEQAKEEEEEEEAATGPKASDSTELQPSAEDLSLEAAPEEEEFPLDSDMPPNLPETEEFKNVRTNYDRDFPQLLSVLKGTSNLDLISVSVEQEVDALNKEIIRRVEGMHRGFLVFYFTLLALCCYM